MKSSKICRKGKYRSSHLQDTIFSDLPDDIIALILSRLPVKPLLKFRCVSKSFCSLISSKQFINTHLKISTKNTNFTNHTIILSGSLCSKEPLLPTAFVPILKKPSQPCNYAFDSFPSIDSSSSKVIFLLGCCNGLSCALMQRNKYRDLFVWNPSTRKSMTLQDIEDGDVMCNFFEFFGFGFDEIHDEYKVLLGGITFEHKRLVRLYGLKSNSRKKIDHPLGGNVGVLTDCMPVMHQIGPFVDGKLHWLMKFDDNDSKKRYLDIISFDMVKEKYGVVEVPTYLDPCFTPTLGVLGGCLSVVCGDYRVQKDIWVLKECWEKMMTISRCMNWTFLPMWEGPKPLCVQPQGEIVFAYGRSFFIFDPKKGNSPPRRIKWSKYCQYNVCIQSLVSPLFMENGDSIPGGLASPNTNVSTLLG